MRISLIDRGSIQRHIFSKKFLEKMKNKKVLAFIPALTKLSIYHRRKRKKLKKRKKEKKHILVMIVGASGILVMQMVVLFTFFFYLHAFVVFRFFVTAAR